MKRVKNAHKSKNTGDITMSRDIEAKKLGNSVKGPETEAKHTPTPWIVDRIGNRGEFLVTGNDRKIAKNAVAGGSISDIAEDRANMEFIVRAVNSHEALLEAAKLLDLMLPDDVKVTSDKSADRRSVIRKFREAIAQAESHE